MTSPINSMIPTNPDDVFVAYNSNNFYWKTSNYNDTFCKKPKCSFNPVDSNTKLITKSNSKQCYEKEICINKQLSETLHKNHIMHSGSDGRYTDSESFFLYTLLNTFNLGIGICSIIYSLYIINKNKL